MYKSVLLSIASLLILTTSIAQNKITWNIGMNVSTNTYDNMYPRMTLDGAGNPLIIWARMSDESVFFSRWNGTMFTTPVKLNPSWLKVAGATWMGPDIASKGDTIYVVVKRTPEAIDTNHIYIIRSFNGGITFSSPVRVDYIADSVSRFPTVTVDATGNPVVAFMKFNSSFMDSRWVVTRSTDFGNTFSKDVKASGYSGPASDVCDCCPGAIVTSGNTTAMLYRDNLSNIRDMWAGISTNNNTSFNSGFSVDNTNWMLMSCPSSGPDGVIIGDSLYTVFMSGAGGYRTYLSKSAISNGTLKSVSKLGGTITGLSQQNFPRIAADGNAMAIVWKQTVGGSIQLPILFTNNITKGFPVAYDTVDLNDVTNADVAMKNGKVFVVWQDDNSGTIKYRSGNFTPAIGIQKNSSPGLFSVYPNPVSNILTIQLPSTDMSNISVTNSIGQQIFSQQIPLAQQKFQLNTSEWDNGIYFIMLKSNDRSFTKKFTKQ